MIGADLKAARVILADVVAVNGRAALPDELQSLCSDLVQTVVDPSFPGALVPMIDDGGAMQVNAASATVGDWRRLKPILLAFAGPTITGFDGVPARFSPDDVVGRALMTAQPAVTAIMRLPADFKSRIVALRSLTRARATLARAPNLQRSAPVPTSWLLARLQDHLNVGRRDAAAGVLDRLKTELRLDALNLKFLQVQLFASFGEWRAITEIPGFASLCQARRTSAVTALLLEALYQIHLSAAFDAPDREATFHLYEAEVRPLAHGMLTAPAPVTLTAGGTRVYALEVRAAPSRADLRELLERRRDDLGWLGEMLPSPNVVDAGAVVEAPIDAARQRLLEAEAVEDADRVGAALAALAKLSAEELDYLRRAIPFAPIVAALETIDGGDPPMSWPDWLNRAADPDFTTALEFARRGSQEWPIGGACGDPVTVELFVSALDQGQQNEIAAERTAQALPYLVAWLQRDLAFPRPAFSPVYSSLLTLFALSSTREAATYDSSQILIAAMLACGLDQRGYVALIADAQEIAGDGYGVEMMYWLLELVELFMATATPNATAREAFLYATLGKVAPIYGRLTELQRVAVDLLCVELGWTFDFAAAPATAASADLASRLSRLRIAIYSLTETASRQAKQALETLCPNVIVDTNADHGGTARLRALSENADLFVMTWLSAKHAATDYIREHRGSRPLLYAQGRGFSSIIRAIEDYFRT